MIKKILFGCVALLILGALGKDVFAAGTIRWEEGSGQAPKVTVGHLGEGAGAAIVNIDGFDPEMIVMAYDAPENGTDPESSEHNTFRYQIGWGIHKVKKRVGDKEIEEVKTSDWTGWRKRWDNQVDDVRRGVIKGVGDVGEGAGLALYDLDRDPDSRPDMVLMAYVDTKTGRNKFRYKVGWNIERDGTTSEWSQDWVEVDGVGAAGEGAGVAIYDIDKNGRPEMILMALDAPLGRPNEFRYRIGWDLEKKSGTDRLEAPRWTPSEDTGYTAEPLCYQADGADLAIYDIDKNGRPEMILMAYEKRLCGNEFVYQIGWDLDEKGFTDDWSECYKVPGLGNEGDGAGVAFWQFDMNSDPDMIFMAYDDPEGENGFRYRVGWDLKK